MEVTLDYKATNFSTTLFPLGLPMLFSIFCIDYEVGKAVNHMYLLVFLLPLHFSCGVLDV